MSTGKADSCTSLILRYFKDKDLNPVCHLIVLTLYLLAFHKHSVRSAEIDAHILSDKALNYTCYDSAFLSLELIINRKFLFFLELLDDSVLRSLRCDSSEINRIRLNLDHIAELICAAVLVSLIKADLLG